MDEILDVLVGHHGGDGGVERGAASLRTVARGNQ
jgi:hypothetical protein